MQADQTPHVRIRRGGSPSSAPFAICRDACPAGRHRRAETRRAGKACWPSLPWGSQEMVQKWEWGLKASPRGRGAAGKGQRGPSGLAQGVAWLEGRRRSQMFWVQDLHSAQHTAGAQYRGLVVCSLRGIGQGCPPSALWPPTPDPALGDSVPQRPRCPAPGPHAVLTLTLGSESFSSTHISSWAESPLTLPLLHAGALCSLGPCVLV